MPAIAAISANNFLSLVFSRFKEAIVTGFLAAAFFLVVPAGLPLLAAGLAAAFLVVPAGLPLLAVVFFTAAFLVERAGLPLLAAGLAVALVAAFLVDPAGLPLFLAAGFLAAAFLVLLVDPCLLYTSDAADD